METLTQAITQAAVAIVVALLGYLTNIVTQYLKAKKMESLEKAETNRNNFYIAQFFDVLEKATVATNQTVVDQIKAAAEDGKLTEEEAKNAFNITKTKVLSVLSGESKEVLTNLYGDLNKFLDDNIQAQVSNINLEKKKIQAMNTVTMPTIPAIPEDVYDRLKPMNVESTPVDLSVLSGLGDILGNSPTNAEEEVSDYVPEPTEKPQASDEFVDRLDQDGILHEVIIDDDEPDVKPSYPEI